MYEADQRHAEIVIKDLGLEKAKSVVTPGSRDGASKTTGFNEFSNQDEGQGQKEDEDILKGDVATKYRAVTARLNYLAQDRPDIQYAVKEAARRMAMPRRGDWMAIKRIARYLIGAPRAVQHSHWQCLPSELDVYVDSDWAGCK